MLWVMKTTVICLRIPDAEQLLLKNAARLLVKGAEGLVQGQQPGLDSESPSQTHTLKTTLSRTVVQGRRAKFWTTMARSGPEARTGGGVYEDLSLVPVREARDGTKKCRPAAAAGAEHGHELVVVDGQVAFGQGVDRTALTPRELLADASRSRLLLGGVLEGGPGGGLALGPAVGGDQQQGLDEDDHDRRVEPGASKRLRYSRIRPPKLPETMRSSTIIMPGTALPRPSRTPVMISVVVEGRCPEPRRRAIPAQHGWRSRRGGPLTGA